ncbi:hypothetical protein P3T76_005628 [Phytophthora citrophthora]|uniref:Cysteine-rich protein n=1 Tax=Phytophthora citrophthora TaxID=4793 RepID=A0AAD9GRT2_9STRA|nr:hypothetical protein P3T76_005628 [Phytophthora citrophthora]
MRYTSTILTFLAAKFLSVSSQLEGNSASEGNSCSQPCEVFEEYCDVLTGECRGPSFDGECYNVATGEFQDGCDPGFECIENKCDYIQDIEPESNSESGCTQCEVFGEYCDVTLHECRAPIDGECYNVVTSTFQNGCDDGYECIDSMCQILTSSSSNTVCYLICSAGTYCENGTEECRGPNYDGECFDPATGYYQNGCDPGLSCTNNQCL